MPKRAATPVFLAAAALLAGLWGFAASQPLPLRPTPPASPSHRQLQCFAEGVLRHTEPRARVLFLVPPDHTDGGLINHRLRYALPGRFVATNHDLVPAAITPNYVAAWRMPPPPGGRVVWRGCGGVLAR